MLVTMEGSGRPIGDVAVVTIGGGVKIAHVVPDAAVHDRKEHQQGDVAAVGEHHDEGRDHGDQKRAR